MVDLYPVVKEMGKVFHILILLLLFCAVLVSCSGTGESETATKGDVFLNPDSGYVFLLEKRTRIENPEHDPDKKTDLYDVVILGDLNKRSFRGLGNPIISRKGHIIGTGENGEIALYSPDDEQRYALNDVSDDKKTVVGYGMSRGGKVAVRLEVERVESKGSVTYTGSLVEFDLDHWRDMGATTIFELGENEYERTRSFIFQGAFQPIITSELGSKVFYRVGKFLYEEPEPDFEQEINKTLLNLPSKRWSELHMYDSWEDSHSIWYESSGTDYGTIEVVGVSSHGDRLFYKAQKSGGYEDFLWQKDPGTSPEVILSGIFAEIESPRLSREGGRVAFFKKELAASSFVSRAVVKSVRLGREDVLLSIQRSASVIWSDDLSAVAYVSNTFASSLVTGEEKLERSQRDGRYLHLVELDGPTDTVIFSAEDGSTIRILDLLAGPEKFEDESEGDPPAWGSEKEKEKREAMERERRKRSGTSGKKPSISTG